MLLQVSCCFCRRRESVVAQQLSCRAYLAGQNKDCLLETRVPMLWIGHLARRQLDETAALQSFRIASETKQQGWLQTHDTYQLLGASLVRQLLEAWLEVAVVTLVCRVCKGHVLLPDDAACSLLGRPDDLVRFQAVQQAGLRPGRWQQLAPADASQLRTGRAACRCAS